MAPSIYYAYFFYDWLFCDLQKARNAGERRAFSAHNKRQRVWLPTYMRRWGMLAALCFVAGAALEKFAVWMAALFFANAVIAVCVLAVTLVCWLLLGQRPETP